MASPQALRADRYVAGEVSKTRHTRLGASAVRPRKAARRPHQSRLTPLALDPVRGSMPAKLFDRSTTVLAVMRPRTSRDQAKGGPPVASAERQHVKADLLRGLTAPAMHLSAFQACFPPFAGCPHCWDLPVNDLLILLTQAANA